MTRQTPYQSPLRSYRHTCALRPDELTFQVLVAETDVRITLAKSSTHTPDDLVSIAREEIQKQRAFLQMWCTLYPAFQHSLVPVPLPPNVDAPDIVRQMSDAAALVGVGPFAAVAGALAFCIATQLHRVSQECLVENGGDTYLYGSKDRVVALLADPTNNAHMGLLIEGNSLPTSICASSATIGHSLSFGVGELAVVRARNAALADAFATDCGNRLLDASSINAVIERAKRFQEHGIDGVFLQCAGQIGIWGVMPLTAITR